MDSLHDVLRDNSIERDWKGQTYRLAGFKPYVRKWDGAKITLAIWETKCLVCGVVVSVTSPLSAMHSKKFTPGTRRCEAHRKRKSA